MRPTTMGLGGGVIGILILLVFVLLGGDPRDIARLLQNAQQQQPAPAG